METLSWALVENRLHDDTPWTLAMGGTHNIRLGLDAYHGRLYLRIPADESTMVPSVPYSELAVALRQDDTGVVLEVSTVSSNYFREFHRFASLLTEEYEQNGQSATGAFVSAISRWQEFAEQKSILSGDQQIGLFGELLLLEALLRALGSAAIDAWIARDAVGPIRHDFRIGHTDIEVKTTRAPVRRHFIHGTQQLVPAEGHDLYILSIRLEPAGANAGRTLPDQVRNVRHMTGANSPEREKFDRKLLSAQYRDGDEKFYFERLILPDQPILIRVDEKCPRITPSMLAGVSLEVVGRIEQVSYQVNLEGLGLAQGTSGYAEVLPNIKLLVP